MQFLADLEVSIFCQYDLLKCYQQNSISFALVLHWDIGVEDLTEILHKPY